MEMGINRFEFCGGLGGESCSAIEQSIFLITPQRHLTENSQFLRGGREGREGGGRGGG